MRRVYLLILFLFLVFSCKELDIDQSSPFLYTDANNSFKNGNVTLQDIYCYLREYRGLNETKSISEVTIEPLLSGSDTAMYLVNYKEGWEILSASANAPIVLAHCEGGSLSLKEIENNEVISDVITPIKKRIIESRKKDITDSTSISNQLWRNLVINNTLDAGYGPWICIGTDIISTNTIQKGPLLTTKWGQGDPWNQCAPFKNSSKTYRCPTGCTFTALGQVCYYYHNKTHHNQYLYGHFFSNSYVPSGQPYLILQNSDIIIAPGSYQNNYWDLIPLDNSSGTDFGYQIASSMMVCLGYHMHAQYSPTGTGCFLTAAPEVLDSLFNINCSYASCSSVDMSAIYQDCIYGDEMPVLLTIYGDSPSSGHVVVVDGYKNISKLLRKHYIRSAPNGTTEHKYVNQWDYSESVTINWGYDGDNDWDPVTHAPVWFTVLSNWYSDATDIDYIEDWETVYDIS